jgi:hypothetical protein
MVIIDALQRDTRASEDREEGALSRAAIERRVRSAELPLRGGCAQQSCHREEGALSRAAIERRVRSAELP